MNTLNRETIETFKTNFRGRLVEPAWNDESKSQPLIRDGLALGHYAFARLYSDLGGQRFPA